MKFPDITKKQTYCRVCMNEFKIKPIRGILERNPMICDNCISDIRMKLGIQKIKDINVLFLSEYAGLLKQMLMNYKEYGDIELAPCFLNLFLPIIKLYSMNSIIVPLPSSKTRIEKRGFAHLDQMLKASNLKYINALESKEESEQKENKASQRLKKKNIVLTKESQQIKGKRIILFDDVITSGSTFFQSLKTIQKASPKTVKGIILMNNLNHGKLE